MDEDLLRASVAAEPATKRGVRNAEFGTNKEQGVRNAEVFRNQQGTRSSECGSNAEHLTLCPSGVFATPKEPDR